MRNTPSVLALEDAKKYASPRANSCPVLDLSVSLNYSCHLGSRRVFASYPTFSPDEAWVLQQARKAFMWLEDIGVNAWLLIQDRDTKFTLKFRRFWKSTGTRNILDTSPLLTRNTAPSPQNKRNRRFRNLRLVLLSFFLFLFSPRHRPPGQKRTPPQTRPLNRTPLHALRQTPRTRKRINNIIMPRVGIFHHLI